VAGHGRIHIVGAPSAGKSTLGRELAHRLGCPYHDLDPVAFVDDRWTLRPMAQRLDLLQQIMEQPCWVTEGGHLGWTEPLLAAADQIVWLDPPLLELLRRHWTRHRHRGLRWLVTHGWGWQVRWYMGRYRHDLAPGRDTTINRATTTIALQPWTHKTLRVRSAPTLEELEQALHQRHRGAAGRASYPDQ
jgi:adenylate kinase family enzyme